jgi:uncharacterized repeat protein (TIGR02543 family)
METNLFKRVGKDALCVVLSLCLVFTAFAGLPWSNDKAYAAEGDVFESSTDMKDLPIGLTTSGSIATTSKVTVTAVGTTTPPKVYNGVFYTLSAFGIEDIDSTKEFEFAVISESIDYAPKVQLFTSTGALVDVSTGAVTWTSKQGVDAFVVVSVDDAANCKFELVVTEIKKDANGFTYYTLDEEAYVIDYTPTEVKELVTLPALEDSFPVVSIYLPGKLGTTTAIELTGGYSLDLLDVSKNNLEKLTVVGDGITIDGIFASFNNLGKSVLGTFLSKFHSVSWLELEGNKFTKTEVDVLSEFFPQVTGEAILLPQQDVPLNRTITLNANGGKAVAAVVRGITVDKVKKELVLPKIGTLPTAQRTGLAPTFSKAGYNYVFAGWYTAATGGLKVNPADEVSIDVTYYAHWTTVALPKTAKKSSPSSQVNAAANKAIVKIKAKASQSIKRGKAKKITLTSYTNVVVKKITISKAAKKYLKVAKTKNAVKVTVSKKAKKGKKYKFVVQLKNGNKKTFTVKAK